jgi:hypothetical protein
MSHAIQNIYDEYLPSDKSITGYHFSNGSIVHSYSLSHVRELLENTLKNYSLKQEFWASEVEDGIWEVQFTRARFAKVVITAIGNNGSEAVHNAISNIFEDLNEFTIIRCT